MVTASNASPSSPSVVATTVSVPASSSANARPEPKSRLTSSTPFAGDGQAAERVAEKHGVGSSCGLLSRALER